jgi:hypothetical protein
MKSQVPYNIPWDNKTTWKTVRLPVTPDELRAYQQQYLEYVKRFRESRP